MEKQYKWETMTEILGGGLSIISLGLDAFGIFPQILWQYVAIVGTVIYLVASFIKTNKMLKIINNQIPNIYYEGVYKEWEKDVFLFQELNIMFCFENYPQDKNGKYLSIDANDVKAEISFINDEFQLIHFVKTGFWWKKNAKRTEESRTKTIKANRTPAKLHTLKYITYPDLPGWYSDENIPGEIFGGNVHLSERRIFVVVELLAMHLQKKYYLSVIADKETGISVKEIEDKKICKKIISTKK